MMRLKPSLKSLVKRGLLLNLLSCVCFVLGCSSSTAPTYTRDKITSVLQDICREEYKVSVRAKLVGQTLWIYLPVKDIFQKNDKPEKYVEKFSIDEINDQFDSGLVKLGYSIQPIPDQVKYQEYTFNKEALEKINNIWKVLLRIMRSLKNSKTDEPKFFSLVIADIKNGVEIKELSFYLDLKKVSYGFISWGEYQHRTLQDSNASPEIIGDRRGKHVNYKDITLAEFVMAQIQHRMKLKFQKPEVEKNADIDKEILKIVAYTLKTYNFRDFTSVELNNLITQNKVLFNKAAIWDKPTE